MSSRTATLDLLARLTRAVSTYRILAHRRAAGSLSLSMTDLKCLDAARNIASLTPGRMAEIVGLSASATTSAIDRLESRGLVRRTRDASDRRRVFVSSTGLHEMRTADLFAPLASAAEEILAGYADVERVLIEDFLAHLSASCEQLIAQQDLRAPKAGRPSHLKPATEGGAR